MYGISDVNNKLQFPIHNNIFNGIGTRNDPLSLKIHKKYKKKKRK